MWDPLYEIATLNRAAERKEMGSFCLITADVMCALHLLKFNVFFNMKHTLHFAELLSFFSGKHDS